MKRNSAVAYVYAVIIISLLVLAFFWFAFYAAITPVKTAIDASMVQYDNNSTSNAYDYATLFVSNIWAYFLALVVIGLAYWGWQYSQRRGQVMY